jgi:hypothetical protein
MFDVATFITRWLFLSNLFRNGAELQTLPYQPYSIQEAQQAQHILESASSPSILEPPLHDPPYHPSHHGHSQQQHQQQHYPPATIEQVWRDHCIRGVLCYPPGTQRWLALDAYRVELIQRLSQLLHHADAVRQQYTHYHQQQQLSHDNMDDDSSIQESIPSQSEVIHDDDDPYWDQDVDILKAFASAVDVDLEDQDNAEILSVAGKQAALVITSDATTHAIDIDVTTNVLEDDNATEITDSLPVSVSFDESGESDSSSSSFSPYSSHISPPTPSFEDYQRATHHWRSVRHYLPQLVSAVLKAPPAVDPILANPLYKLRRILLDRCQSDPDFGIALCWLLEAEVGREWKALLEHRQQQQQSRRRLIVLMPADKAAIIARIGKEKQQEFEFLQEVEQATAYGHFVGDIHPLDNSHASAAYSYDQLHPLHPHQHQHSYSWQDQQHAHARLPSSLSVRRCRHFGDTMQFIDRLTEISLDLRMVPLSQREHYLHQRLYDMNRRLRRRMISRGEITLDVEDSMPTSSHGHTHHGHGDPNDTSWPRIHDLSVDLLQYSVHFPLIPQTGVWPDGTPTTITTTANSASQTDPFSMTPQVVGRVLNIVVPESRLLSSRERCPYLVHVEIADSGLEGSDARLYATAGTTDLGSTMEEALGMGKTRKSAMDYAEVYRPYSIPRELSRFAHTVIVSRHQLAAMDKSHSPQSVSVVQTLTLQPPPPPPPRGTLLTRGGWQSEHTPLYDGGEQFGFVHHTPMDMIREQQYEQLHQELQSQPFDTPAAASSHLSNMMERYVFASN